MRTGDINVDMALLFVDLLFYVSTLAIRSKTDKVRLLLNRLHLARRITLPLGKYASLRDFAPAFHAMSKGFERLMGNSAFFTKKRHHI